MKCNGSNTKYAIQIISMCQWIREVNFYILHDRTLLQSVLYCIWKNGELKQETGITILYCIKRYNPKYAECSTIHPTEWHTKNRHEHKLIMVFHLCTNMKIAWLLWLNRENNAAFSATLHVVAAMMMLFYVVFAFNDITILAFYPDTCISWSTID